MSVSGVSSAPTAAINVSSISVARAADGDYKARNALSAQVKDKDGDYRPIAATSSAAAQSSVAVQSSLPSLKRAADAGLGDRPPAGIFRETAQEMSGRESNPLGA